MRNRKYSGGKFSPEQYKNCNDFGISRITNYLKSRGYNVHEKEEEDYDVDIVAEKDGKIFKYEAETKSHYPFTSVEDYKFDTVSFLGRKKKYHERHKEGFYYCILCIETECLVYCHSSKIFKDEYKIERELNTKHRKGADEFYLVPKEDCSFINISANASL